MLWSVKNACSLRDENTFLSRIILTTLLLKGALVAAVISSAFTWPATEEAPWTVPAAFYSALIMSLSSVWMGSQLNIFLYRLGASRKSMIELQELLREEPSPGAREHRPKFLQKYLWHFPVLSLSWSLSIFLIGLTILILDRATTAGSWQSDAKVSTLQSICLSSVWPILIPRSARLR